MQEWYQHQKEVDFKRTYLALRLSCNSCVLLAIDVALQSLLTAKQCVLCYRYSICGCEIISCKDFCGRKLYLGYRGHLENKLKQAGWTLVQESYPSPQSGGPLRMRKSPRTLCLGLFSNCFGIGTAQLSFTWAFGSTPPFFVDVADTGTRNFFETFSSWEVALFEHLQIKQ